MKKLSFCFILILCFLFSACNGADYIIKADVDKEEPPPANTGEILYIVNTSSRTYHLPSCYILDRTKDENKAETYDLDFLIEREYTPCKICIN